MGAITGLLFMPIIAPVAGIRFLVEQLHDEADAVARDEGRVFAELLALSMRHNRGELSDADYSEQETELLDRLSAIRDYRNELLRAQSDEEDDGLLCAESDEEEENMSRCSASDEDDEDALPDVEAVDEEEES